MRRIFFRISATLLGAAFIAVLAFGELNQLSPLKRVLTGGLAVVFLLYGLVGERAADAVLGRILNIHSTKPKRKTMSSDDPFDEDDSKASHD